MSAEYENKKFELGNAWNYLHFSTDMSYGGDAIHFDFGYIIEVIGQRGSLLTKILQPFCRLGESLDVLEEDIIVQKSESYDEEKDLEKLENLISSYDSFLLGMFEADIKKGFKSLFEQFNVDYKYYYEHPNYPESFLFDYFVIRVLYPLALEDSMGNRFREIIYNDFPELVNSVIRLGETDRIIQSPDLFISESTISLLLQLALEAQNIQLIAYLMEKKNLLLPLKEMDYSLSIKNEELPERWSYFINEDGEGVLTGFLGVPPVSLLLPQIINGIPIKHISSHFSFTPNQQLWIPTSELIIPEGYSTIFEKAFGNATTLETIEIGSTVIIIGKKAFEGCKKLSQVSGMHGCKVILDEAFRGCSKLLNFTIQESLEEIGENVFPDLECEFLAFFHNSPYHATTRLTISPDHKNFELFDETLIVKTSGKIVHFPIGKSVDYNEIFFESYARCSSKLFGEEHILPSGYESLFPIGEEGDIHYIHVKGSE